MAAKTFEDITKSYEKIEKYNPYHGKDGRFTTGQRAVSFSIGNKSKGAMTAIRNEKMRSKREYGSGDASAAVAEQKSGKANSLSGFIDKDGNVTPERAVVHKEIIDKILSGKSPVDGQATLRILGGGPASGKSTAVKMGLVEKMDKNHSIVVDPDGIKEMLPGYAEMAKKDEHAAAYYHEESSMIAKQLHDIASRENLNVTYDGTGDGSPNSLQKKIDTGRKAGYKVEGVYVTIDTEEAVRRNQQRYEDAKKAGKNPRLVDQDTVRQIHADVTKISVQKASEFDSIVLIDNNGPKGQSKIIGRGGNGKGLTPVPGEEKAFQSYLDKANHAKKEK